MVIQDADSYAEYCLECMRKHLDTVFVNLGEIEQRLIYKPEPDTKVRKKVESIIADLEAAEQHALDNTQTTEKERQVLAELTNDLRKTRKLLEMTRLGYRDERIKPVGGLADIQLTKELVDRHLHNVHFAIAEIGCGDCETVDAQMGLVKMRSELKKELEKPKVEVKGEEIKAVAEYDPETHTTQIGITDIDVEKTTVITQTIPQHAEKVKVEELGDQGQITIIQAIGEGKETTTMIGETPTAGKELPKTPVQEMVEKAAKNCKESEDTNVCVTKQALDIYEYKKERKHKPLPTTSEIIDQIQQEMEK